jgi:CRISPR-associated protein Csd2
MIMTTLQHKIDFALIFRVIKANPNGDPLNGNRPRTDCSGRGEVTDVCLKRKLRDRLLDRYEVLGEEQKKGQAIFVQSDDRKVDDAKNLRVRAERVLTPEIMKSRDAAVKTACNEWFDVRAFGQVFPFKGQKPQKKKSGAEGASQEESEQISNKDADGISIPVRGPVTIQSAFSVERVDPESSQIVKSTSLEGDGEKRQSDQMGMKHRVDQGVYVFYGSMNPQLAERTGFSEADAEVIKQVLPRLFENDESSARPAGSMEVLKVIWWKHNCKAGQYSSAKVHRKLTVKHDGTFELARLDNLEPEIIDGF